MPLVVAFAGSSKWFETTRIKPCVENALQDNYVDTLDINELASGETLASRRRERSG
jgi:hypothetical protein